MYRETQRPIAPMEPTQWHGIGGGVFVHGHEINHPLTYVGTLSRSAAMTACPAQIDRALPVARTDRADPLPYWPSYGAILPEQRFIYLRWLASGRKALPENIGYLFLYFYGLEHRALVDEQDLPLVMREVYRLRRIYRQSDAKSSSFLLYSAGLLWHLVAVHPNSVSAEDVKRLAETTRYWSEDSLAAALAWFAGRGMPLPDWMARIVAQESPLSQRSVVVSRVAEAFQALFAKKYAAAFGSGLPLRSSKRLRTVTYRPASATIRPMSAKIPNPLGIASQFQTLSEIWNDCVAELKRLSSLSRDGTDDLTPERWEALPPELRRETDHPLAAEIYKLVAARTNDEGHTFIQIGEFARLVGIEPAAKLTGSASERVAVILEQVGFGMEPDYRLTKHRYRWDDWVTTFPLAYSGTADPGRYGAASCILRLGLEVAAGDGHLDDDELARVLSEIETNFDLNDHEQRRLEALRTLLLKIGTDVSWVGRRLRASMTRLARESVGRLLVGVAAIDHVITSGERTALRRCFRALELPAASLEACIADMAPASDDAPVQVASGGPARPGEPIPAGAGGESVLVLDHSRIMHILTETREVSAMLADAMQLGDRPLSSGADSTVAREGETTGSHAGAGQALDDAPAPVVEAPSSSAIPEQYAAIFRELISRESWSRQEAVEIARRHNQMLAGVVEGINDWAFECYDAQLVYEEDDGLTIDRSLMES